MPSSPNTRGRLLHDSRFFRHIIEVNRTGLTYLLRDRSFSEYWALRSYATSYNSDVDRTHLPGWYMRRLPGIPEDGRGIAASGWPLRCMMARFRVVVTSGRECLLFDSGVVIPTRDGGYPRVLPLRPMWPEVIACVGFWSAASWGPFAVLRIVRARRRRIRRQCPLCGYPRTDASSDRCPECGAELPHASRRREPSD